MERNKISQKFKSVKGSASNELLECFIGIILVSVGLFMLSKRIIVHTGWHSFRFANFSLASGTIVIPLIIGIIWHFYNPKSIVSNILITVGVVIIVAAIIMSVQITFLSTTMFDYILIIGMIAAGAGLLLKTLFKKR